MHECYNACVPSAYKHACACACMHVRIWCSTSLYDVGQYYTKRFCLNFKFSIKNRKPDKRKIDQPPTCTVQLKLWLWGNFQSVKATYNTDHTVSDNPSPHTHIIIHPSSYTFTYNKWNVANVLKLLPIQQL